MANIMARAKRKLDGDKSRISPSRGRGTLLLLDMLTISLLGQLTRLGGKATGIGSGIRWALHKPLRTPLRDDHVGGVAEIRISVRKSRATARLHPARCCVRLLG